MNWYDLSDKAVIEELTRRVRQKRLNMNMTQRELSQKTGLHVQTIKKFESGNSVSLITLIQLMRAFDNLELMDKLFPDPGISPIELLKLKGKERRRASGDSSQTQDQVSEW